MSRRDEQRLVRVTAVEQAAVDVRRYELSPADGRPLPPFEAGAHIDVYLPNGFVRAYSLCDDPTQHTGSYTIAVKKDTAGRGGSVALHEEVEVGLALGIAGPRNGFPLADDAAEYLFIAGGIGITPIRAMIHSMAARGQPWTLHYCARSLEHAAFYPELAALGGSRTIAHFSELPSLEVVELLCIQPPGTHVYCCGPAGLMKAVEAATAHWAPGHAHFEWFSAPEQGCLPNRPLEVLLARSGAAYQVPRDKSILHVLREHGIDVPCACEEGVCGSCETAVLEGVPEHRDVLLSSEERRANRSMMLCVSRAESDRLVLDL